MMSGKYFSKSHVLSWQRKVYSDWEDVTSSGRAFQVFGPATGKARTDGWSLDRWHQKMIGASRTKRPSAGKTAYCRHERSKVRRCTSVKNSDCQQGDLLYSTRSKTRNKWWRVANASVMWSADRSWKITRAAAFSTDCSRCTRYVGMANQ